MPFFNQLTSQRLLCPCFSPHENTKITIQGYKISVERSATRSQTERIQHICYNYTSISLDIG